MNERLLSLLICPSCGTSPRPSSERCPGCGRTVVGSSGQLDLLDDDSRREADRFAAQYRALRTREGWADSTGREDPESGKQELWHGRLESVSEAATLLAREWSSGAKPVVADIGSGGGWAARHLRGADVIAFDLLDVSAPSPALAVRADMRKLPMRSGSVDAVLYSASLHYAPVAEVVAEAARVLRPGGLMVAVDSPIYKDARTKAQAAARSAAYYSGAGYPELSDHYHPINVVELRAALTASGFVIERLRVPSPASRMWLRLARKAPTSLMAARRGALG